MDARGKFGEHERSVRVARGAAESKSSFFFLAGSVEVSVIRFRSGYDRFYRYIGVLRLGCKIVTVISGISLYRGSLNRGFVPHILL